MDIKIICEEAYGKSIWCKQILSGLTSELRKKRHRYFQSNHIEDAKDSSTVYIIGTNPNWLNNAIRFCNSKGIVPIVLCNQTNRVIRGQYHCVCADTYGVIKQLYDNFYCIGKTKIALYGVNPLSISDVSRMECFLDLIPDRKHVYENNGSLENCFQNFLPHIQQYDAVICVNGYVAISLVEKLELIDSNFSEQISIASCTKTLLSAQYESQIAFVDLNLNQYGRTAVAISEMTENRPYITGITITIAGNLPDITRKPEDIYLSKETLEKDLFYEDSELIYLSKMEHLLSECSKLDCQIIQMLLQKATYSKIADACFMSEGAVKYHIKKYMEICNVKTKQELIEIVKRIDFNQKEHDI